jgi:hypothetical protein
MTTSATHTETAWGAELTPFLDAAITTEYASLTRDGRPVTVPLTPYRGATTLDVSTGLTYPAKAERARRNPRVALLFADPVGTGLAEPPVVLVQGLATVRDGDLQAGTDRYVRESMAKLPAAYEGTPWFLLRRSGWYFTRIWIEVTPLRITWWERGRLDAEPRVWTAAPGTTAPPSDPAPTGVTPPPWQQAPADWRAAADRAERLGVPDLTLLGADGWPLPLAARAVERVDDGFVVTLPAGTPPAAALPAPVCLTFHVHAERFTGQENVTLVGTGGYVDAGRDRVHVRVERALGDFSLPGGRVSRLRATVRAGRRLDRRLAQESGRRGQPVPVVRRVRDQSSRTSA